MGKTYPLIVWLFLFPSLLYAQQWVDMGVRAENGDVIYWSNSDFEIYRNGNVGFAEYGEIGSSFGWGDITGMAVGSDLLRYGGENPPSHIEGNPRYDIITAKLGSPYRLPSFYEFNELAQNCEFSVKTVVSQRNQGKDGLPSWVQGQWMCNNAALINGQVFNASVSLKFDGVMASVYTSDNDYWEGTYSYSNGILKVWKLKLNVNESNRTIKDDRDYQYQKISNKTESGKIKGMQLKSKINGNTLFFPFPSSVSSFSGGGYTIVGMNTIDAGEATYWIADLCKQDRDKAYAAFLSLYENSGIIEQKRSNHNRIRAIKVDVGSGAKWMEEKRIAEQKAAEERAKQEKLERQRAEEKRKREEEERKRYEQLRIEAYESDPIIKALSIFDNKENTNGVFDYKLYKNVSKWSTNCKILILFYSNKKTKELSKLFNEALNYTTEPNIIYRPFIMDKFSKVLPSILECMQDFSIRDAAGHTYDFKLNVLHGKSIYDGNIPYSLQNEKWFECEISGMSKRERCNLFPILDNNKSPHLAISNIEFKIFPFLQSGLKKGYLLYYCYFSLPDSAYYSIVKSGKIIQGEILTDSYFSKLLNSVSDISRKTTEGR